MRAGSAFGPIESIQISSMDWHLSIKKLFERLSQSCWSFIALYIESNTSIIDLIHILKHRQTKLGFPPPPLNYAQIENTEGLPLHQVTTNYQFSKACLDAYWSSSWAAGAIYFLTYQQIQQETSWLDEHLETNGMGGEAEEPVNSSNLINRLQLFFKEKLVLQPLLHKVLAASFLGSLASCHTFILDKRFFEYFFKIHLWTFGLQKKAWKCRVIFFFFVFSWVSWLVFQLQIIWWLHHLNKTPNRVCILEYLLGLSSEVLEQVFGKPLASVTEQAVLSTTNT